MFYTINNNLVTFRIKAQANASNNAFCEVYGDNAIKIRIKAPAVEGSANKELIKFISKSFKIPKSLVEIKSGQTSKIKVIIFPYSQKFQEWIDNYGKR